MTRTMLLQSTLRMSLASFAQTAPANVNSNILPGNCVKDPVYGPCIVADDHGDQLWADSAYLLYEWKTNVFVKCPNPIWLADAEGKGSTATCSGVDAAGKPYWMTMDVKFHAYVTRFRNGFVIQYKIDSGGRFSFKE